MSVDEYRSVLARFEKIADRLENAGGGGSAPAMNGAASAAASHEHVLRFDDVLEKLKEFTSLTDQIGNPVLKQQTDLVAKAFALTRDFVIMSTQCKPPADDKALSVLPLFKELSRTIAGECDVLFGIVFFLDFRVLTLASCFCSPLLFSVSSLHTLLFSSLSEHNFIFISAFRILPSPPYKQKSARFARRIGPTRKCLTTFRPSASRSPPWLGWL